MLECTRRRFPENTLTFCYCQIPGKHHHERHMEAAHPRLIHGHDSGILAMASPVTRGHNVWTIQTFL